MHPARCDTDLHSLPPNRPATWIHTNKTGLELQQLRRTLEALQPTMEVADAGSACPSPAGPPRALQPSSPIRTIHFLPGRTSFSFAWPSRDCSWARPVGGGQQRTCVHSSTSTLPQDCFNTVPQDFFFSSNLSSISGLAAPQADRYTHLSQSDPPRTAY